MTEREQQSLFVTLVARLIEWATASGYELTFGEAWRSDATAELDAESGVGIVNSLHRLRLAVDLNLFRDGELLGTVEDYHPLGDYWCSLHPLARWGGNFTKPDADHFSLEWNGVQ